MLTCFHCYLCMYVLLICWYLCYLFVARVWIVYMSPVSCWCMRVLREMLCVCELWCIHSTFGIMLHVAVNSGTTHTKWSASTRYAAALISDSPSVGLLSYTIASYMSVLRMSSCLPLIGIRSYSLTAGSSSRKALPKISNQLPKHLVQSTPLTCGTHEELPVWCDLALSGQSS